MASVSLIRVVGTGLLAGSFTYVFGPDILLHWWPKLNVAEACALTNPLAFIIGMGGACFCANCPRFRLPIQFGSLHSYRQQRHYQFNIPALLSRQQWQFRIRDTESAHRRQKANSSSSRFQE